MTQFVVIKTSRGAEITTAQAKQYSVYSTRAVARLNAKALSYDNPVGFYVIEVGLKFPKCIRDFYAHGEKFPIPEYLR